MKVTPLDNPGNSSKFQVATKHGEFVLALSFTLRTRVWELPDADAELAAAQQLAEAIVSRHDHSQPFRTLYIFAEHNTPLSLADTVNQLRKSGY